MVLSRHADAPAKIELGFGSTGAWRGIQIQIVSPFDLSPWAEITHRGQPTIEKRTNYF
jgi:hypothetical protein